MKKVLLKIDGMTCSACSSGLEKFLNKQDGVVNASVNLVMNNANIEYDENKLTLCDLENFVSEAGFESLGIDNFEKEEKKKVNEKYKLWGISIVSIFVLYISMSHMVGLPVISFLDMLEYPLNFSATLFLLTTVVLFLGRDVLKNGYKNLKHGTPNMDTLVTIGVLASYIYSIYGTIKIIFGSHEFVENLYYESAAIVIFFIKIGKFIENKNKDKTKEALQELMSITPNHATLYKDGKEKVVTLDEISKGDVVICKPGEKIAVDGEVVEGATHINESFITGESLPVKREVGSKVIAGSINFEGTIKYKAEKIGKESIVSSIVRLVVEATNTKAPIAKIADKISGYFVPVVLGIAFVMLFIWLIILKDFSFAINVFVSVLVVACPCSLGLATPLAIVIASGNSSKKGILVKTSEALENAHKVQYICFDKTGTLTKGNLTVSKIFTYGNVSENDVICISASLEKNSEHPIAKAILNVANTQNLNLLEIKDFKAIAGFGIEGKDLDENRYLIGNKKLMTSNNVNLENEKDEEELTKSGNSILFVSKNENLIALIGVKDVIKDNAKDVISDLKNRKINVVMLTGDNEETAKIIAGELGINEVIANVTPEEKSNKIKELKQKGMVMMCGDGINDSVSLVTADIGVSVSTGTDIAMDSSEVVIMSDDISKISDLLDISKATIRNIKENLFWAFFYNVCMIPIACGIFNSWGINMNPMIAAFAMTLSSLTVVLNALRLKR